MSRADLYKFANESQGDMTTAELEQRTKIAEWGKWSRGGLPTGKGEGGSSPSISDEEALRVDREMAELKNDFYRGYYILVEIYKWGMTIRALETELGLSNREIMSHRDKGLSILYGRLSQKVEMVHRDTYTMC